MKVSTLLTLTATLILSNFAWGASDLLARHTIRVQGPDAEAALNLTIQNPRAIFEKYEPVVGSGSEITSPLRLGGTESHPVLLMSIRKCVFVICKTVDLDAEISIREVTGKCDRNFMMDADLARSGQMLTDVYDRFNVSICFKKAAAGDGTLDFTAQAHQAPSYSSGIVQRNIFEMLQLQIGPITKAINDTLRNNSGSH